MITLKWECPENHTPYTKARVITHEIEDEATLDEMLECYEDFLRGIGYNIDKNSSVQIVDNGVEYNLTNGDGTPTFTLVEK